MYHSKHLKRTAAAILSSAMLLSCGSVLSAPAAAAAEPNYAEALAMSLYFFDSNACGTGITNGPLTWRGDCHTYDATASVGKLSGSEKSVVDPDGDGKVDVSGGYHDAGDHIKFNVTIGFGMQSLALSDYMNPGVYEKAGCRGHLLYILRRGCDYLMKTTFLDDSGNVAAIAHVVAEGGKDHSYWSAPEVQDYEREVFWLTAGSNNSAVCGEMSAALGGTAYLMKDIDPEYSAKCLKYAKALEKFGTAHVGNENGGLGSFYAVSSMYQDEIALADAWLWINGEGEKPSYSPKNGDYGGFGDWDKYQWDKVWQGFAALMYKASGDQVYYDELKYEHEKNGLSSNSFKSDAGWGNSRYNCALQMTALALAGDDADSEYAKAAKYQMDYILGNNSYNYSFLLGYGDKWPTHIHHRAANPGDGHQTADSDMAAKYTNYGMLVGGANNSGYKDTTNAYEYTEGALDYNGSFALACAGLYKLYGGDAAAFPALAKNASEINDSFDFGYEKTVVTETTTSATETTTTTETTTESTGGNIDQIDLGNVNCRGGVDVADAVLLARFNAEDSEANISAQGKLNADADRNGRLDGDDVIQILKYIAKLIEF